MKAEQAVVLITGAAKRIGAAVARYLHQHDYRCIVHYRHSVQAAEQLVAELNAVRPDSAYALQADLADVQQCQQLAQDAAAHWGRLDGLINNASQFYPTPFAQASAKDFHDLFASNVQAPFFLSQALADPIKKQQGCIINMLDIYATRPLPQHSLYCMSKAAMVMMTQTLAQELGPAIRVNGVAPGAILWPEQKMEDDACKQQALLQKVPLQCQGDPLDIAKAVYFLIAQAPYITGQIITVDGGRAVNV